jgi:formate hydrogenlyase subunit 4
MMTSLVFLILAMLLAPIYAAWILKVKAFFGGRKGSPLLINYYTLIKLLKKGSVYSTSTTVIFKMGPAGLFLCGYHGAAVPAHRRAGPIVFFKGDVILLLYLLGLGRFFTIAAAMDTASPFEGMGAAREAYFPIICEATLFMILILFYILTGELNLAAYFSGGQPLGLLAGSRRAPAVRGDRPFHRPADGKFPGAGGRSGHPSGTDHDPRSHGAGSQRSGFRFHRAGLLPQALFSTPMVTRLICPFELGHPAMDLALFFGFMALVYVGVGVTESVMARYRMDKVPKFVLTSFALAFFATVITLEFVK